MRLDERNGPPLLEALAAGRTNVAAQLLIEAMASSMKQRWWSAGAQPEDEAGRWWTSGHSDAYSYARDRDDASWMIIPVVMTASIDDALGEGDSQGQWWWHLPPGHPVTITEFEAFWPDDPKGLLADWKGITSPGNFDPPQSWWDGQWRKLPIPPMRTTASSWRGLMNGPVWASVPAAILVDKTGGNRQSYEVYIGGQLQPRAQRLQEAKDRIEERLGPCTWERVSQEPIKTDHYYFGPQEWFGDPTIVYVARPVR